MGVGAYFGGCEGRECVEERVSSFGEVADGQEVEAIVGLEAIPSVPVTTAFDQSGVISTSYPQVLSENGPLSSIDVFRNSMLVIKEHLKPDHGKDNINFCTS